MFDYSLAEWIRALWFPIMMLAWLAVLFVILWIWERRDGIDNRNNEGEHQP